MSTALGYIPKSWRRVKVIFIPKPGRQTYTETSSFRPISLTSFLLKILERLVEINIRNKIQLHDMQFAYQKSKSTETALHKLVDRIEGALKIKEFALGIFIDISGAFDNASFDAILRTLRAKGIRESIINWIHNMLRLRIINADNDICVTAVKGCPQGGVLSPLLWLILADELISHLNKFGFYTQAYADDFATVLVGQHIKTLEDLLNTVLNEMTNWCNRVGLSINCNKTTMVLFTNRKKIEPIQLRSIKFKEIKLSGSVKYLGITLDSKLSWKSDLGDKPQDFPKTPRHCIKN